MDIQYLIYVSEQAYPMTELDLRSILDKAVQFNRTVGVTGLLLFRDGIFVQFLEGLPENVEKVMEKILEDRRHKNVEVLVRSPATERVFPQWFMGSLEPDGSTKFAPKISIEKVLKVGDQVPRQSIIQAFEGLVGKSLS